jgi:hypothetical protein
MNIYILYCKVVEVYACRGAQTWWGARLACMRDSLVQHVNRRSMRSRLSEQYVTHSTLLAGGSDDLALQH